MQPTSCPGLSNASHQTLSPSALSLPAVGDPAHNIPPGPSEVCASAASHYLATVTHGGGRGGEIWGPEPPVFRTRAASPCENRNAALLPRAGTRSRSVTTMMSAGDVFLLHVSPMPAGVRTSPSPLFPSLGGTLGRGPLPPASIYLSIAAILAGLFYFIF